jgi:hypothetical protein
VFDRDRILSAIDLAGLADELVGPQCSGARSASWHCPSPMHAQTGRTPPVAVFRGDDGIERWHCHGCGTGGTAIDLVMAVRSVDVREALEELASRAGVPSSAPPTARRPDHRPRAERPKRGVRDPDGLRAFVDECAMRLWSKDGEAVLRWLTESRGLPEDVLRLNRIGADAGRRRQPRPSGMPGAGWAVVLPVLERGRPVFAQLRLLSGGMRYLNASADLAPNPRIGLYDAPEPVGECVLATEGVLDALSACAGGYRGAAILGAAVPDPESHSPGAQEFTERLKAMTGRPVLAFDADEAGQRGAANLGRLLAESGRPASRLNLPSGVNDLNEWACASRCWPTDLRAGVREAINLSRVPARSRCR